MEKKKLALNGSMVALVTPFLDDSIDEKALRQLVEYHVEKGTKGIVPCGTTGESATLSYEEHERVIDIVVQTAAGRIPVIAGTGSNNTAEAIRLTQAAEKAGADGALLISPYYNRPTQEGLYQHYRAVSETTRLPLVLYSIKSRTGVNIEPETVARLAEFSNIVGIKEASGDLNQMSTIIGLVGKKLQLVSGDDSLTLPVLAIGGVGVISVLANIMPVETQQMIEAFTIDDRFKALELHYRLLNITKALFIETNPVPVKTALSLLGMIERPVRLPLCRMSVSNETKLKEAMQGVGLL